MSRLGPTSLYHDPSCLSHLSRRQDDVKGASIVSLAVDIASTPSRSVAVHSFRQVLDDSSVLKIWVPQFDVDAVCVLYLTPSG